ncbi:MAG TPA: response regulator [Ignavibacteriaceae bacterium]|jgi:two-component system cell cycle response regulator|nr:MAG: Response regulator PleD [Ignavibacteria bacterium ADurb.Bin266]OQY69603.1 MAG: response regulator [Ignavibacteriales bacterium UTCHB2]HQF43761.1 response regulator [Ignavibacteriaceae bacterium]HQI40498.1 response regulator [Ignavibacteriaceae bacterium]HQJ46609.1 response regulator [Ignavibacteriaceae bacterium]
MKRILVIDDLPENVFMLQDRLEHEGFEVLTAYDGYNGIDKAKNEQPDLILLDIMMPDITGLEVCKILVNDPVTKDIPIILVTAKSGAEDTKEGLEAGAFDYIKKPFNRVELLARVQSALKLSEAHKLLLASEKRGTYIATVVTANHKIKQPLTLLSLSSAAIKRELSKDEVSKEGILKRVKYIDLAIKEITDVLNQLNAIKDPVLSNYTTNIKMVKVDDDDDEKDGNRSD